MRRVRRKMGCFSRRVAVRVPLSSHSLEVGCSPCVVVLSIALRQNLVRDHRTGSSISGVEEFVARDGKKSLMWDR